MRRGEPTHEDAPQAGQGAPPRPQLGAAPPRKRSAPLRNPSLVSHPTAPRAPAQENVNPNMYQSGIKKVRRAGGKKAAPPSEGSAAAPAAPPPAVVEPKPPAHQPGDGARAILQRCGGLRAEQLAHTRGISPPLGRVMERHLHFAQRAQASQVRGASSLALGLPGGHEVSRLTCSVERCDIDG